MKTIICDFKRSSLGVIGEENEHNAIELLFNLPKDFEAADYIHVEFDTMNGDPFARDTFEFNKEEMTLRGRLDQKVMKAGELKIQLVGYAIDEEGTIDEIAKSPVIKAIVGDSVNGILREGDENPSMIELLKAKLDKLLEEGIGDGSGGGIDTVDTVNDLPADAEQDDIAFVKEAAFVETVEYQEEAPIVLQGGEQILNIELRQEPLYLSEINLNETLPELKDAEGYAAELGIYGINGETSIMAVSYPASVMVGLLGIEQPVDMYQIMHYGNDDSIMQYYRLRGMSIKDYMMSMVEVPATEEQMQLLLGEHYNDKTEDNPSYEWIKASVTEEPINENSVFLDDAGAYVTVEFDAIIDLKGLSMFEGYYFSSMKMGEEGPEEDFSIDGDLSCIEEYEKEEQDIMLKFGNVLINTIYSGGLQDISYDVYTQKGFHKFDEGWKSLEEDMNIPKVVNTYSDLPKSFIKNGFMVVANEEKKLPEPTNEISAGAQGLIAVKPHFSVAEEMERIKQFAIENGAPEDLDWENGDGGFEIGFYDQNSGYETYFGSGYVFNNDVKGIMFVKPTNKEDIVEIWCYADEAGAEIELPRNRDTGSYDTFVTAEGGCWYYYKIEDDKDYTYLITSPKKYEGTEPFFISDKNYVCAGIWVGFYLDDFEFDIDPNSYTFGFIDFYDSSKVKNYPKGFYQYSNNRWYNLSDLAGGSKLENEAVLKKITNEMLAMVEESIENSHYHNNKSVLDGLPWDTANKLNNDVPQNTNARHTHNNKNFLDSLDASKLTSFENAEILKKFKVQENKGISLLQYDTKPISVLTEKAWITTTYAAGDGTSITFTPSQHTEYNFINVTELKEIQVYLNEYTFSKTYNEDFEDFCFKIRFYSDCYYDSQTRIYFYGNVNKLNLINKFSQTQPGYVLVTVTKKKGIYEYDINCEFVQDTYNKPFISGNNIRDNYFCLNHNYYEVDSSIPNKEYSSILQQTTLFPAMQKDVEYANIPSSWNTGTAYERKYTLVNGKYVIWEEKKPEEVVIINNNCLDCNSLDSWDNLFAGGSYETLEEVVVDTLTSDKPVSAYGMFDYCFNLKKISNIDFSKVTRLTESFTGCSALEEITDLDLRSFEGTDHFFDKNSNIHTIGRLVWNSNAGLGSFIVVMKNLNKLQNCNFQGSIDTDYTYGPCDLSHITLLSNESAESLLKAFKYSSVGLTVYLANSVYETLSEEQKNIATAKNINLLGK